VNHTRSIPAHTPKRPRTLARVAFLLALGLSWPGAHAKADDVVTLRPSARVLADRPILLRDVAEIHGESSESLGAIDLSSTCAGQDRLTLEAVREAIDAGSTVNWGRLSLSGSNCRITRIAPAAAPPAPSQEAHVPAHASDPGVPTVRASILPRIADSLGLPAERLRLTFDADDRSLNLLNTLTIGRTVEVRPIGRSDSMPIAVTVYEDTSIIARGTVRATVEVLRDAAFARAAISRSTPITDDLIERRSQWLPLSERPFDPAQLTDAVAAARIAPGRMLTEQSVEAPLALKKGDPAMIHCLSGGFVMKLRARALADARPGDTIDFAPLDGRKGRTIRARVDRAGIAIANTDLEREPAATEGTP
jgi:flagella basal body P-ring formation protein FlgA